LKIIPLMVEAGIEPILHVVTVGRDTSTHCALAYVAAVNAAFATAGQGRIASVSGRFSAMDRADHWDRTEQAWKAMVRGVGLSADTAETAIQNAYARGESDELITPTMIGDHPKRIEADEFILTLNFRSDRMRQLVAALGLSDFTEFGREADEIRQVVTMVEYENTFPFPVLFSSEMPSAVLAEVLSEAHLLQFYCAETEKYPHVTYFFNGGQDAPFAGEARQMIPSAAALTYDVQPEMSAEAVADAVVAAVERQEYQFIVVNFVNGDMVGHTAVPAAIIQVVKTLDLPFHRVVQAALRHQFRVILTADHGNCDEMVDAVTNKPHTRHTP
jgi:2,3-bisphosphoglycerate-independent phosphoglycerate mutase